MTTQADPRTAPQQPQETGPWDAPALAQLREWDPQWAETCFKMSANPWAGGVLPRKTVELIGVALNAACTNLNPDGTRRHIRAALDAGASRDEVLMVLKMASLLSIHSCSLGAPLLLQEAKEAGVETPARSGEVSTPACDAMRAIGQWNTAWDPFFELDPVSTDQFMATGAGIYASGLMTPKLVELLSIAFDVSYTHMYAPGTRRHIKNAMKAGATPEEIMEVLKICVAHGVQACNMGVPILAEESSAGQPAGSHARDEEILAGRSAHFLAIISPEDFRPQREPRMPGPFPGMDPYLEDPALWPGVHAGLIAALEGALNAVLPAQYAADIGERVYLLDSRRDAYPDLAVARFGGPQAASGRATTPSPGEAAVLDPAAAPWVVRVEPREVRETFLQIRAAAEGQRIVTVIEVLSPSNKAAGSHGRKLYQQKQEELLRSETHLVEIDLLRGGAHTVAAPLDYLVHRGPWSYLVCLHRGGQDELYELWPVGLRQRLPLIKVPLAGGDPDVTLDLQQVLERRYEEGRYGLKVDYHAEPLPPLTPADQEWAVALLQEQRLR